MHRLSRTAADLAMYARLTRDLGRYLRRPVRAAEAAETIRQRLERRAERFLWLAERAIYAHPRSPYRRLLGMAGCELGDLRALVAGEGLEGALRSLARRGVYVSFEEFKGGREIARGSERFTASAEDFDHPFMPPHFGIRTGGTRSAGTAVRVSFPFMEQHAVDTCVGMWAHGLDRAVMAYWLTAPFYVVLLSVKVHPPAIAWFHPISPLPWQVQVAGRYLQLLSRLSGCPLPGPVRSDLDDPTALLAWISTRQALGQPICLRTNSSAAVRLAIAARERGLSLAGVCFLTLGEPFTDAKKRAIEAADARWLVNYGFYEAGGLAYSCTEPRVVDDVHLMTDAFAVVQRSRPVGDSGLSVEALLITTLLPGAPKIMLNAESGDHGVLEERDCACALGALGLRTHLSEVRSFEKLTGEGMTFIREHFVRLLEEILPEHFGGSSADYQVVEEEGGDGIQRLHLLISPRIGPVDEAAVKQTFLAELGRGGLLENHMATRWARSGTVEIRREAPRATWAGKILPFHLVKHDVVGSSGQG